MTRAPVPLAAAVLGAAGLLPFLWAVLALQTGSMSPDWARPRPTAMTYGLMIYCYMAGCFWPFAAHVGSPLAYIVAVLPVLGLIALVVPGILSLNVALALGFAALLPIDRHFWRKGAAPAWWMRLRVPLSAVVIACLVAILLTGGGA